MATLGNVPAEAYTNTVKDSFSGNGSTTAFTMSLPTVTNDVRVVVENVIQDPTVAYSVSGTTLTFTSAPPSGTNNVYVVHLGPAVMTTVPPAEIADATTFASSLTVQGAFTSQGIDDNGNATALTIDGSENVLIGQSTSNFATKGIRLRGDVGQMTATRDGGAPVGLNRLTSDGSMLDFSKDGTSVGSINVGGGNVLAIGQGSNYIQFHNSLNSFYASDGNGGRDNAMDIGASGVRFKDAYLSGGIYLGGTGSANKLDDYEEGTFTPTVVFGSGSSGITYSVREGKYTKIGNTVQYYVQCSLSSKGSSTGILSITGLPFTNTDTASPPSILTGSFTNTSDVQIYLNAGGAALNLENRNTGTQSPLSNSNVNNNSTMFIAGVYRTSQ
ncbi:hypothetical protein N9242_05890 [Vicingaceae bacterium]|nr:hypothetical protein [Vicingaceae bacterium]